jgi:hypothetical protein
MQKTRRMMRMKKTTMEKKYQGLGYEYFDSLSDQELIESTKELKGLWKNGTRLKMAMNLAIAAEFRRGEKRAREISFDKALNYLLRDSVESVRMFRDQPIEDIAMLLKMFKGEPILFDDNRLRVGEVKYLNEGCELRICGTAGTLFLSYTDLAEKCLSELRK